jgi:hypothetical protein
VPFTIWRHHGHLHEIGVLQAAKAGAKNPFVANQVQIVVGQRPI